MAILITSIFYVVYEFVAESAVCKNSISVWAFCTTAKFDRYRVKCLSIHSNLFSIFRDKTSKEHTKQGCFVESDKYNFTLSERLPKMLSLKCK
jgi:hypothetical protein